jgi:glycerol-3-phosphate dehydrogenase
MSRFETETWRAYGTDAALLDSLIEEDPSLGEPIHPRLPYQRVHVIWAARHEMARSVEDVLARRTRSLLLDARASIEAASSVAECLAKELGHDADWARREVETYTELALGYTLDS